MKKSLFYVLAILLSVNAVQANTDKTKTELRDAIYTNCTKDVKSNDLVFFQGDLLEEEIRNKIKAEGPFDLVVCDAAPPTTGNRTIDTLRSKGLVEMAIWYAQDMLKAGGNFCVKIFQNGDQQKLLMKMREIFEQAKGFKPEACRQESFETYLIGLNKKGM